MNLFMLGGLVTAAIIPVAIICFIIYINDKNREPIGLLFKVFILGFFTSIPIIIIELILDALFPSENITNLIIMCINTFICVALVEEGFKWLVTRFFGYNSKEFDEIYDIIVYAVFVSLGFACCENILYVVSNGLGNAIVRGLLSVPGHACDGVLMGYFFALAKLNKNKGNSGLSVIFMILSLFVPCLTHTIYDAFIFTYVNTENLIYILSLFLFYFVQLSICIVIIIVMARVQQSLHDKDNNVTEKTIKYCPDCGENVEGCKYCRGCGNKIN